MVEITTTIIDGGGSLPKDVNRNSLLRLDASQNSAITYEWEMISWPKESTATLKNPISPQTLFGPLDKYGVYAIRGWLDRNEREQKSALVTFSVPRTKTGIVASVPPFNINGRIRNGEFQLPGPLDGWAAFWSIVDEEDILATGAGTTRGRIQPVNFVPESGDYAMCLGDDENATVDFAPGSIFSVSQEVDFTDVNVLTLKLKFGK